MSSSMFCKLTCLFYKSRRERTAFDKLYFRWGLNTSDKMITKASKSERDSGRWKYVGSWSTGGSFNQPKQEYCMFLACRYNFTQFPKLWRWTRSETQLRMISKIKWSTSTASSLSSQYNPQENYGYTNWQQETLGSLRNQERYGDENV